MNNFKLARINTGNSIHLAQYFESVHGVTGYEVYCGSGKTGFRSRLHFIDKEVKPENITCKKCLKRYNELNQTNKQERLKSTIIISNNDIEYVGITESEELKQYIKEHGKSTILYK